MLWKNQKIKTCGHILSSLYKQMNNKQQTTPKTISKIMIQFKKNFYGSLRNINKKNIAVTNISLH